MFKQDLETLVNALSNAPELPAKYETELSSEKEASYNEGFKAGIASVSSEGDKVYSQEDMDNFAKAYDEKLAVKDEEIIKITTESEAKTEEAVKFATSEMLMEIEADLQAAQDSENATELEFKNKLEARKV